MNNFDVLEKFSSYFLSAAHDLIEKADKDRILVPNGNFHEIGKGEVVNSRRFLMDGERLTTREKDVAALLVTGATAKDIASALGISHRTVENHVENMKQKLRCTRKSLLVKELLTAPYRCQIKR